MTFMDKITMQTLRDMPESPFHGAVLSLIERLDSEVVRLRALQARLDSVGVLPEKHGTPTHQMDIKHCSYCEGWDDGIDAYRGALLKGGA